MLLSALLFLFQDTSLRARTEQLQNDTHVAFSGNYKQLAWLRLCLGHLLFPSPAFLP